MVGSGAVIDGRRGGRGGVGRLGRVGVLSVSLVMVVSLLTGCDTGSLMLSGQVSASPSGTNLGGVPVAVFSNDSETQVASATTNLFGRFQLHESSVPAGTYRVRIGGQWWPSAATWADATPVTVSAASPGITNMVLAQQGSLFGRIVDAVPGAPVAGVYVAAQASDGSLVGTAVTNSNGEFQFGLLAPGTYTVIFNTVGGPNVVNVGGSTATVFTPGPGDDLDLGTIDLTTGLQVTTAPPADPSARISVSDNHSCAIRADHTVACWGDVAYAGTFEDPIIQASDVAVDVAGISDAIAVAAGSYFTCVLRAGGTVVCWGGNVWGLGDGTLDPVEIPGITDATAIAADQDHACALRSDGTIKCWGYGYFGQLGDGTNASSDVPVDVVGISDATAISAGALNTCALRANGAVVCWGDNFTGQLGDGTNNDSFVPVEVTGIDDAIAITSGRMHACAVRATGTVACWGSNDSGQLGDGTNTDSNVPVDVSGIGDATSVAGGGFRHSCAARSNGMVACWGGDQVGQLGDGTYTDSNVPVAVVGIGNATAIAASTTHSCALRSDETVVCWGSGGYGQLGDGTSTDSNVPVQVLGF